METGGIFKSMFAFIVMHTIDIFYTLLDVLVDQTCYVLICVSLRNYFYNGSYLKSVIRLLRTISVNHIS